MTVYFPRCVTDNVEVDRAPQTRSEHLDGRGRTVLVVEDEQSVRAMVMEILQDEKFRAISATDGAAGLEVLDSEAHIDLLITDVGLPVLDGRELAEAARRRRSDLKVLFISGYPPESPLTPVQGSQPDHLIVKPFTLNALLDRIHDALRSAAALSTSSATNPIVAYYIVDRYTFAGMFQRSARSFLRGAP